MPVGRFTVAPVARAVPFCVALQRTVAVVALLAAIFSSEMTAASGVLDYGASTAVVALIIPVMLADWIGTAVEY